MPRQRLGRGFRRKRNRSTRGSWRKLWNRRSRKYGPRQKSQSLAPRLQRLLAARTFLLGLRPAAAMPGPTRAMRGIVEVSVIKVVIVGEFLACGDVANGADENPSINFIGFAVWIARVIDEGGNAVAVNDALAVCQSEEVGPRRMLINRVGLIIGQLGPGVFDDDVPLLDGSGRVNAVSVDVRSANNQGHVLE